jgi:isoleucyl-tRNA synthetase
MDEGLAREMMNRIQRLRKKAELVPTDQVEYLYQFTSDPNDELKSAFESQMEFLSKNLKQCLVMVDSVPEGKIIAFEEQEVCLYLINLVDLEF